MERSGVLCCARNTCYRSEPENALIYIIINRGEFANLRAKDHGISYIKLF